MSAAAGRLSRLFRMAGIALAAALGITAAWPDADEGQDHGASLAKRAFAREYPGFVTGLSSVPPIGGPVARYDLKAAIDAVAQADSVNPLATANISPSPHPAPHPEIPQHDRPAQAAAPEPAIAPAAPTPEELPQIPEPPQKQPVPYTVIAYYLNVRAEPDKTSPIRGLLKQGDRVQVVGKTENGWLELEDGLYIHGDYAEPAERDSEPADKNAGREVTIASASPSVQPEPAVYKPDPLENRAGPAPLSKKVESSSGMTADDIAKLLEGTALEGHGLEEAILGIEEEYGINAFFTIAVMKLESGNGKSKLAREKNNLFGLNATGGGNAKAYSFETKSDSVYKFGSLIAKSYIDKGYSTIEKVGKKYCPANPKWASHVESIMKRDHRKLGKTAV